MIYYNVGLRKSIPDAQGVRIKATTCSSKGWGMSAQNAEI